MWRWLIRVKKKAVYTTSSPLDTSLRCQEPRAAYSPGRSLVLAEHVAQQARLSRMTKEISVLLEQIESRWHNQGPQIRWFIWILHLFKTSWGTSAIYSESTVCQYWHILKGYQSCVCICLGILCWTFGRPIWKRKHHWMISRSASWRA